MNFDRNKWTDARRMSASRRHDVHKLLDAFAAESQRTGPCDREASERAVCGVYAAAGLPRPNFTWFGSPVPAEQAMSELTRSGSRRSLARELLEHARGERSVEIISALREEQGRLKIGFTDHDFRIGRTFENMAPIPDDERTPRPFSFSPNAMRFGSGDAWELGLIAATDLFDLHPGVTFPALLETMRQCGWWFPTIGQCLMIERPLELHFDGYDLHRVNGPAVLYPDGTALYFIRDRAVPERVPYGKFNAADIDAERNMEIRMAMIHVYGMEKYLSESAAELIQQDEFGKLYRKDYGADLEPLYIVRVKNSTPEPDGTYKEYVLRVPPLVVTAREAVAWTFGMRADDYAPKVET